MARARAPVECRPPAAPPPTSTSTFSTSARRAASPRASPICPARPSCSTARASPSPAPASGRRPASGSDPACWPPRSICRRRPCRASWPTPNASPRGAGVALEHEIYYLSGGRALAIAGYLTDHRSLAFLPELALSPALLDLAVRSHGGRPYVLGRWQGSFARDKFGDEGLARLVAAKAALDPARLLGRGVLFGLDLRGPLGAVVERVYRPGVRLAALAWGSRVAPAARLASAALRFVPGPGASRRAGACLATGRGAAVCGGTSPGAGGRRASASLPVLARPLHCVNCGECNAVCPLYDALALRLPQSLVHAAETAAARRALPSGAAGLLDLCLRCGSCEQVCQAGIAHLATYAAARGAALARTPCRRDRTRPRGAAGHAGRPAPHAALPARLPGAAPGRVPAAHAGLGGGPRLLPGAARRGRRRRGLDLPPLRGLRGRLPVGRQPRVRGRRRRA